MSENRTYKYLPYYRKLFLLCLIGFLFNTFLLGYFLRKMRFQSFAAGDVPISLLVSHIFFVTIYFLAFTIAFEKKEIIPLTLFVAVLIALLMSQFSHELKWILYPNENQIGLGDLGRWIDQNCSRVEGCNPSGVIISFVEMVLISIYCAFLQKDTLTFRGGVVAGFIYSLVVFLLGFFVFESLMMDKSPADYLVALLYMIAIIMAYSLFGVAIAIGGMIDKERLKAV